MSTNSPIQIKYNTKTYWLCQRGVQILKHPGGHYAPRIWSTNISLGQIFLGTEKKKKSIQSRTDTSCLAGVRVFPRTMTQPHPCGKGWEERTVVMNGRRETNLHENTAATFLFPYVHELQASWVVLHPKRSILWSMCLPPISLVWMRLL